MTKLTKKVELAKLDVQKAEILERIKFDADMISLTDLWKEAGSVENKKPAIWKRQESTQQLIDTILIMSQSDLKSLWKTTRGGSSAGTYAHKSIALAYAKYLSPELHILVNRVFFERIEEEKNPELILDRAVSTYEKQGKTKEWIAKRLKGKVKRNEFTDCLSEHGVKDYGYGNCTNDIYNPILDGKAHVIKKQNNLKNNVSLRDYMTENQLLAIEFAESLAIEAIKKDNLKGNDECRLACNRSAQLVANVLKQNNQPIAR